MTTRLLLKLLLENMVKFDEIRSRTFTHFQTKTTKITLIYLKIKTL